MTRTNTASRAALALRLRLARARASTQTDPQRPATEPPPLSYERPTQRPPATRPPPRPPPSTRPPPTGKHPEITSLQHSVWGTSSNATFTTYQGIEFGASGPPSGLAHAVLNHPMGMLHEGMVYDNCRWLGLNGSGNNMRWGLRAFDIIGPRFQQCEFKGKLWEHGAYLGAPLGVNFTDVIFDGMRAAGYQEAHRWWVGYEGETIWPEAGKVHSTKTFKRCSFKNLGDPLSDRFGAFSLSMHPAEIVLPDGTWLPDLNSDVLVEDSDFAGDNFEHNYSGQVWRSNRSWMVGNRKSLTMRRVMIDCPKPVHGWCGQAHNVPEVALQSCDFREGKVEIKNATRVSISGCMGGATVRVGNGPGLGEGLTEVIYEGPITKDWEYTA